MQLQRIVERIQDTRMSNPDYAPWESYLEEGQQLLKAQEASYERPPPETDRLYMNIGDNQVGLESGFVCVYFLPLSFFINPLRHRPATALSLQNPLLREVTVKWSRCTTLKINNKHQTKVSAHFVFFPVCEYSVLVYPTGIDFFFTKKWKHKNKIPSQKCPHQNVRFWGAYRVTNFAKFPVWISQDEAPWVCQGAHGKRLSQICSLNIKRWSSDTIANSRAFVYFRASIVRPSRNFVNSQHLWNFARLWTKDITRSSKQ